MSSVIYKRFIDTTDEEFNVNNLKYSCGCVRVRQNRYIIEQHQIGAEHTFCIGMPMYDYDDNLLGYLALTLLKNLNYAGNPDTRRDIPCEVWCIENPTKYCKDGVKIQSYWQKNIIVDEESEVTE